MLPSSGLFYGDSKTQSTEESAKHNVKFLLNLDMSMSPCCDKNPHLYKLSSLRLPLLFIYYNCFKKGKNHREDIRFLKFHIKVCCLQKCHTWQQICPLSADSFTVKVSHSELEFRGPGTVRACRCHTDFLQRGKCFYFCYTVKNVWWILCCSFPPG